MKEHLKKMTGDALTSVLPITMVVLLLGITFVPLPVGTMVLFLIGAVMLIIGLGFLTTGIDMSLISLGEDIGIKMTYTKKLFLVVAVSFAMGFIITMAEPDVQVLAGLVASVPNIVLVLTVSCGVGIFLVLAIIRILLKISLSKMLIITYGIVIALSFFTPDSFVAVAFDAGGVTTGPITVPFILAMGLGLASIRGDKDSKEDSFGLVALCSIGPIIAVMLLGIFYNPEEVMYTQPVIPDVATTREAFGQFLLGIPHHIIQVAQAVWPILAVVMVFQITTRRYRKMQLVRILIGYIYAYIGLVVFLSGVSVGFIPVGQYIGSYLAEGAYKWLLIPLGGVIGYSVVRAEPAVHVLKKQVEEITGGGIPGKAVQRYLSIGAAAALALTMFRVITGISIYWFVIPGYLFALTLTFFVPKLFTGIAFDSGGVVTGPITSTFLLPLAIGACISPDRIMLDAFGLVAMMALSPLIAIQLMGIAYKRREQQAATDELDDNQFEEIIEFEYVPKEDPDDA